MVALLVTAEEWLGVSHKGARAWGVKRQKKNPRKTVAYDTEEGAHATPCKEAGCTYVKQIREKN